MGGSIYLQPMSVIRGKWYNKEFRVIKRLGSGGTASIYLVREISCAKEYALKISRDMAGIDREYRILGQLASMPYIPGVYCRDDCIIEGEVCYFFSMGYFQGENLKRLFHGKKIPQKTALKIVAVTGSICCALNRRNLYYCDIKPENLIFDRETGSVCIIDFGGVVGKGEAVTQFTPDFDRASWGMGERIADEGYQGFALLMMLLGFLMGDLGCGGRDFARLKARVDKSQLSKNLKKVIIEGLKQKSPGLKRLAASLMDAAGETADKGCDDRRRVDAIIDIGLLLSITVFAVILIMVLWNSGMGYF
jgi:serine/threonine-protein kinase